MAKVHSVPFRRTDDPERVELPRDGWDGVIRRAVDEVARAAAQRRLRP